MRVLHVTNRLSEGGVETFLFNLLPALRNVGIEADLLVLDKSEIMMAERFRDHGVNIFISPYDRVRNLKNIKFIMDICSQYDIVHSHLFPSQYFVAIAGFLKKKKLVTTEHCNFNKRRKKFFKPIEYIVYALYDAVVGVSVAATNNLNKWLPILRDKNICIVNGIELKHFDQVTAINRKEINVSENSFLIVMTARFFKQKDHLTLVEALPHLPTNVEVIFIGSGETMDASISEAKKLNISHRCHFLGRRQDVAEIIKTSDLCVLSTFYEGLPISVIEYMASGKAVVATKVDGLSEMIDDSCLAEPGDPKDLANKINKMICDSSFKKLMETRNIAKSEDFSIEKMVSSYISLYKSLS
ncbi:glycosyltransferase family 4 protein [Cronobacter turicensis]